jgi:hypothetical protein
MMKKYHAIFLISIIFFSGCRKTSGTEVPASTASVNITSVTSQNQNIPEDSKKISEVADFVKNLVPENIWTDMEKRQKEFEESFEN